MASQLFISCVTFFCIALVVASAFLPSQQLERDRDNLEISYLKSFRQILANKSAVACLLTTLLTVASGQIAIFSIAFYRTKFALPIEWSTVIVEIGTSLFIVIPLISGRLVNRVGPKRFVSINLSLAAICLLLIFFMPNLYAAVAMDMLHLCFGIAAIPAFIYLTLEQVPKNRGTMMSLNSLFSNMGNVLAPAVGGAMLVLTAGVYEIVGIVFGGMTLIGVVVLIMLVRDTTKLR